MKPNTLACFKADIRAFSVAYDAVAKYFDRPEASVVSVLLQNLGFTSTSCEGYSHAKEELKCKQIVDVLEKMATYHKESHYIQWAYEQASFAWEGYEYYEEAAEMEERIDAIHDEIFHDTFN